MEDAKIAKGTNLGAALLINNEIYPEGSRYATLTGTHVDIRRVKAVLDQIGFAALDTMDDEPVEIKDECCEILEHNMDYHKDSSNLIEAVQKFCDNCDERAKNPLKANTMALVYIASHGDKENIISTNPDQVSKNDLIEILSNCKALDDKPIIVIVDACRSRLEWWRWWQAYFTSRSWKKNILLCLACEPNKASLGNKVDGGHYTKHLTDVLCKRSRSANIIDMLDDVKDAMDKDVRKVKKGNKSVDYPQTPTYYTSDIDYWRKFNFNDHFD